MKARCVSIRCLFFYCLVFLAYNFALSAIPPSEAEEPAATLSTVQSRRHALAELIAERALLQPNDAIHLIQVNSRITELHLKLSDLDSALATATQSLNLAEQLEPSANGLLMVDTLNLAGFVYIRRDEYDNARQQLNKAWDLGRNLEYKRGEAQTLQHFSEVYFFEDNLDKGEESTRDAITIWRQLQDQKGEAISLLTQGEIYTRGDKPDLATTSLRNAETILRNLGAQLELATTLLNLNFVAVRQGQWQNALAFLNEAQTLVTDKEAEPFLAGQIAMGLGEAHEAYGQLDAALMYFQQSLSYYDAGAHNISATIDAGNKVGRVMAGLGNFDGARQQIERGLVAAEGIKSDTLQGLGHEDLGRVFLTAGSYEQARIEFQTAVSHFEKVKRERLRARALGYLGQTEYLLGNPTQANAAYKNALNFFTKVSDYTNEAVLRFGLGKLALDQNNLKEAQENLQRSILITERLRENASSKDFRSSFLASVHDRYETYVELLMALHVKEPHKGLDIKAFEASEFSRARALLDTLRNYHRELRQARDPLDLIVEERLQEEEQKLVDERARLLSGSNTKEAGAAIDTRLTEVRSQYETLQARIMTSPKFKQLRAEPLSYQDLKTQVTDSKTSLLEFSLGNQRSFAWVVTRDGISYAELRDKRTIETAVKQLVKLLTDPSTEAEHEKQLQAAITDVSRLVLEPVASKLQTSRLIIVPDGILQYIPFQILSATGNAAEPLIDKFHIVNAPSGSFSAIIGQQRANRQPGARLLVGFGDPVFSPASANQNSGAQPNARSNSAADPRTWPRLMFSKDELRVIQELAGDDSQFFVEYAASRKNLLDVDLSNFRILHMVTHGVLHSSQPELSGLMLSLVDENEQWLDGFVGLADIYKLNAPVDLVVLSACHSALGAEIRGEGLIGLTRGFMYAGASSIVASLWKVDDEAGGELMKHFYSNMLERNMPPAEALRAAQNTIRQQPQWRSPYFWAGFTFQGDYNLHITKPPAAKRNYWTFIGIGFLAAAFVAGSYWFLRRRFS